MLTKEQIETNAFWKKAAPYILKHEKSNNAERNRTMGKLELYDEKVLEEDGQSRTWVRKERLEELQRCFNAMCAGHAHFIDLVHEAVVGKSRHTDGGP